MRRTVAFTADAVVLLLSSVVIFIVVTGGGAFDVRGQRISVAGVDNPLLALSVLAGLRCSALRGEPLFGVDRWPATAFEMRAHAAVMRLAQYVEAVSPRSAAQIVALVAAGGTLIKTLLGWYYPGFFSGDDVEVHEMSLSALWDVRWPIWDLRNPLFPLGVIYPIQKIFAAAGANDPASLVFAGRLAVAAISSLTIVLLWRSGRHLWPAAPGWGLVAAALFAVSQLHIAFGSSELPRPVATVLVVGAFVLLLKPVTGRVIAAGVLLGIAASLRFSEAVFLVPALWVMARERRWMLAVALATVTFVSALGILAATDAWYWDEPLHSLNAAVDYTLVQRLSSRGYQNPLWYLLNLFKWLSPAIAVFAIVALVRARRVTDVWLWAPVVLLSLLPHKEARYMIPVVPFACLAAARGLQIVTAHLRAQVPPRRDAWLPLAIVGILFVGLAHDAGHWRLPRSNADVAFARALAAAIPSTRRVAIEQAWRAGGRLYLHPREVFDLDPDRLGDTHYLWGAMPPGAAIVVDSRSIARHGLAQALHSRGYEQDRLAVRGSRYQLWIPVTPRAASAPELPMPLARQAGRTPQSP